MDRETEDQNTKCKEYATDIDARYIYFPINLCHFDEKMQWIFENFYGFFFQFKLGQQCINFLIHLSCNKKGQSIIAVYRSLLIFEEDIKFYYFQYAPCLYRD